MTTDSSVDSQQGPPPAPSDAGLPTPSYTIAPTLLGTWTGYFENFTFPSKSDAIRLSLTQNDDGTGKVSVVLGMGTPPPPPTNAAALWPPTTVDSLDALDNLPDTYIEGFAYDAYEVQWDGERLKFTINDADPWQPYCHLQTSYYVADMSPAGYDCTPGGGSGTPSADGTLSSCSSNGVPLSCMQVFACAGLCLCEAGGCRAGSNVTTSFDITFTGTKGQGNVTIDTGHDVMLTQVATADGGQP